MSKMWEPKCKRPNSSNRSKEQYKGERVLVYTREIVIDNLYLRPMAVVWEKKGENHNQIL
jgi:hypothetical protein